MIDIEETQRPAERAGAPSANGPVAVSARYDKRVHRLVIGLATGIEIAVRPRDTCGLETAKASDLDVIEISPSGQGLHFPKLDADLDLPSFLDGFLGARAPAPQPEIRKE